MAFYSDSIKYIIQEWKKEAKITGTILYRLHSIEGGSDKMELVICTNRPGHLIGYKGNLIDKYTQKLNNSFISKKDIIVKFIETDALA